MRKYIGLGLFIISLFYHPHGNYNIAWLNLAIPAITALAGGLANRSSMPKLSPDAQRLQKLLIDSQIALNRGNDLTGYEHAGINTINENADAERKKLLELLAAHGVSGPMAGFAAAGNDRNRFANITKFQQTIPLLAQNLRADSIASGSNLFRSIAPGNVGQSGNVAGGLAGGFGSALAYLYGQGAFGPNGITKTNSGQNLGPGIYNGVSSGMA